MIHMLKVDLKHCKTAYVIPDYIKGKFSETRQKELTNTYLIHSQQNK